MTPRQSLLQIAEQNKDSAVECLISAINEANVQLKFAAYQLHVRADSAMINKDQDNYSVCGSFLAEANNYEVAAGKLNTLFLTLACVLEAKGIVTGY